MLIFLNDKSFFWSILIGQPSRTDFFPVSLLRNSRSNNNSLQMQMQNVSSWAHVLIIQPTSG